MFAIASETYSVLRGESTNAWADPTDADTVVLTGVPIALQPVSRGRTARSEGMLREVDTYAGWAPYGTDLQLEDRIRGETTGLTYVLSVVTQPMSAVAQGGLRVECRKVLTQA